MALFFCHAVHREQTGNCLLMPSGMAAACAAATTSPTVNVRLSSLASFTHARLLPATSVADYWMNNNGINWLVCAGARRQPCCRRLTMGSRFGLACASSDDDGARLYTLHACARGGYKYFLMWLYSLFLLLCCGLLYLPINGSALPRHIQRRRGC